MMKKNLMIVIVLLTLVLSGCSIKGNPNIWAANMADSMNAKIPFTKKMAGTNLNITFYNAYHQSGSVTYEAITNMFETLKEEMKSVDILKSEYQSFCTSWPTKQVMSKGLVMYVKVKPTKESNEEVIMIFSKSKCLEYGYNID